MRRTSSQAWEAAGVPAVPPGQSRKSAFEGEGVKGAAPAVRDVGDVGVEGGALTRRRELVVRVRHAHHVHGRAAGKGEEAHQAPSAAPALPGTWRGCCQPETSCRPRQPRVVLATASPSQTRPRSGGLCITVQMGQHLGGDGATGARRGGAARRGPGGQLFWDLPREQPRHRSPPPLGRRRSVCEATPGAAPPWVGRTVPAVTVVAVWHTGVSGHFGTRVRRCATRGNPSATYEKCKSEVFDPLIVAPGGVLRVARAGGKTRPRTAMTRL